MRARYGKRSSGAKFGRTTFSAFVIRNGLRMMDTARLMPSGTIVDKSEPSAGRRRRSMTRYGRRGVCPQASCRRGWPTDLHRREYGEGKGSLVHGKQEGMAWKGAQRSRILARGSRVERRQTMKLSPASMPTRRACSLRMVERGEGTDFAVFESDIGYSTYSYLFGEKYPERYFNFGIAEVSTMAAAAGMASSGRTVSSAQWRLSDDARSRNGAILHLLSQARREDTSSHGGSRPPSTE